MDDEFSQTTEAASLRLSMTAQAAVARSTAHLNLALSKSCANIAFRTRHSYSQNYTHRLQELVMSLSTTPLGEHAGQSAPESSTYFHWEEYLKFPKRTMQ